MPLRQQRDNIARLIDNHSKQSGDVASEHTDIERFQFCDSCELATDDDFTASLSCQLNLCSESDRINQADNPLITFALRSGFVPSRFRLIEWPLPPL